MNIMIVEAQRMTRTMLARLCVDELGHRVVAETGTGSGVRPVASDHALDLLILALELPDIDGLELIGSLRRSTFSSVKVLVLASSCSQHTASRVARACVHGFVDKSTDSIDQLRLAIAGIENGQSYFSQTYWQLQSERQKRVSYELLLTDQEKRVFEMLARLMDDEDIARVLKISMRTLEGHRLKIMDKLDAPTRVSLLRYARDWGLLSSSSSRFNHTNCEKNSRARAAS